MYLCATPEDNTKVLKKHPRARRVKSYSALHCMTNFKSVFILTLKFKMHGIYPHNFKNIFILTLKFKMHGIYPRTHVTLPTNPSV